MESLEAVDALRNFLKLVDGTHIESTGATVTSYAGVLYNVDGSTPDPKIGGFTWKQLLINYGINNNCYVTNAGASGSHPAFNVGGHMTVNSNGSVARGGTCYLMPLCYFHNSTSQNGTPFTHALTTMLLLSGYMQGDLAVTFAARMPSDSPFSIVYLSDKGLETHNLGASAVANTSALSLPNTQPGKLPENHVLFRRILQGNRMMYAVEQSSLPG